MQPDKLAIAIQEAERFLDKAKQVHISTLHHSQDCIVKAKAGKPYQVVDPGKASAACKRASLDLTKALADMRRSY